MESSNTYLDSYNYLTQLEKKNTFNSVTIDYDKMDTVTQGEIRNAISGIVSKRKKDIGAVIFTAK